MADNDSGVTDRTEWERFHDLEAPTYDLQEYTRNAIAEVDFLIEALNLSAGESILDVACGTGRHSVELARRGYAVTGIDISAGMLAQAEAKARAAKVSVELIRANACSFCAPKQFDAAICLCEGAFGLLSSTDDPIEQPLSILRNISHSLKPGAKSLFTVLNGLRFIRSHAQADVEQQRFNPATMTAVSEVPPSDGLPPMRLVERGFIPTELDLLFRLAGMSVLNMWGGTAGNWGRRTVELDEMEIMILAENTAK